MAFELEPWGKTFDTKSRWRHENFERLNHLSAYFRFHHQNHPSCSFLSSSSSSSLSTWLIPFAMVFFCIYMSFSMTIVTAFFSFLKCTYFHHFLKLGIKRRPPSWFLSIWPWNLLDLKAVSWKMQASPYQRDSAPPPRKFILFSFHSSYSLQISRYALISWYDLEI